MEGGARPHWSQLWRLPVPSTRAHIRGLLRPLIADPEHTALLFDIDGTLAPIVLHPDRARVPDVTRNMLRHLRVEYRLVACISGRQALDARRVAGVDDIEYVGNHGMEDLPAGSNTVTTDPAVLAWRPAMRSLFESHRPALDAAGVEIRDKDVIISMHWLGSPDPKRAKAAIDGFARAATRQGFSLMRGKGVVEVRPPVAINKGVAIRRMLEQHPEIRSVLYAGDDRTDVDALRELRKLVAEGRLERAVRIGVGSADMPLAVATSSNAIVSGIRGLRTVIRQLDRCVS